MAARRLLARLRKLPIAPLAIVALFILIAVFADFIAPYDPYTPSLSNRLMPPFWQQGGDSSHILGTDSLGRDILSRIIYGSRTSLAVSCFALLVGAGIGTTIGLISGYHGGKVDAVLMRAADATMAFPILLFALLLAVTLKPSFNNVVIAVGLVLWARYARMVRGEVLTVMRRPFIDQARVDGCSGFRIIVRHLLPNIFNSLLVLVTLQVGWVIIVEASLSFLGAGIPPPTPVWGGMVADGRNYITTSWWISLFPGLAILLVVLSFNLLGDWLRDALDPKLRQA